MTDPPEFDSQESPLEPELQAPEQEVKEPGIQKAGPKLEEEDWLSETRNSIEDPAASERKVFPLGQRLRGWLSSLTGKRPALEDRSGPKSEAAAQESGVPPPVGPFEAVLGAPGSETVPVKASERQGKTGELKALDAISKEAAASEETVRDLRDDLRQDRDGAQIPAAPDVDQTQRRGFLAALLGKPEEVKEEEFPEEALDHRLATVQGGQDFYVPPPEEESDQEEFSKIPIKPPDQSEPYKDPREVLKELRTPGVYGGLYVYPATPEEEKIEKAREEGAKEAALEEPSRPRLELLEEETAEAETAPETAAPAYPELRKVALEDYAEVVPKPPPVSTPQIVIDWLRSLSTLQKLSLAGLLLINVIIVIAGAFLLIRTAIPALQLRPATAPTPAPQSDSGIPYPTELRLPGGWPLSLKTATIVDGKWAPAGPEWLQGTEIRRWIAFPWSKELEAVFRTIEPGDEIVLKMSNQDEWTYTVQSVEQVSADLLPTLNQNKPSVLIFLANDSSATRWVVIASR